MYERAYALPAPIFWVFCDSREDERIYARLRMHVEQGDCLPFLATLMSFIKEAISDCPSPSGARLAENARRDLLYLHEHYDLTPKEQSLSYSKRKMVRFDA